MTAELFEDIRLNAQKFVSEGLVAYEKAFGELKTDVSKQKFLSSGLELLRRILDRVEAKEEISVLPFKEVLLQIVFDLDASVDAREVKNLLPYIQGELIGFIRSKPNFDVNLTRIFDAYFELFAESVGDLSFYSSSSATDILQSQPEYQYSETLYSIVPREIDSETKTIYTVVPKERYWETFSTQTDDTSYSPLSYNRFASNLGLSKYKTPISYDYLIIYNNKLYKLRPDISSPTRNSFEESEWIEFSPKRFDKSKSFSSVFLFNVKSAFGKFTEEGFVANEITSDSDVPEFSKPVKVDEVLLVSTFGGAGKQILNSIRDLKSISDSFGAYEGSPVGGIEYITKYSEYLLAASFGRNTVSAFDVIKGNSLFGHFNDLYKSSIKENKIPGLKFLDSFGSLKSFVHGQTLPQSTPLPSSRVVYNPVYSQFSEGLFDRFTSFEESTSYTEASPVDLLLYSVERLYKKCLIVGDTVKATINTLDEKGRVPGYEGLGSVRVQMEEFQRVFPPTSFFTDNAQGKKITPGLTGAIRFLLDSYSRFSSLMRRPILPGKSLEFFRPWIELIANKLEEVIDVLESVGAYNSRFIPNISFKAYEASDSKLVGFLESLGFRDSEINKLLQVNSFPELISNFAPLSDSSDLKSFLKAYELAQLIYEFGGQEGVDAYLSFLYSNNQIDSLLNILRLSQRDKSRLTYVNMSKYPKLIGLLVGLTYAVDPTQLIKFEKILKGNNLSLLESISYLFQSGETTIIKNREDIELLLPLVEQMITGVYEENALNSPTVTYEQINSLSPIALKQWTNIIGNNLGKVESVDLINRLYDRSKGLTPKELISILNDPTSPSELGQILDGYNGGDFTLFLKYSVLTGVGVKLSNYKNSYQINNFEVDTSYEFYTLPRVVTELKGLVEYVSVIKTVFSAELDYNFQSDSAFSESLQPLVLSQNKVFETIPAIVSSSGSNRSVSELRSIASSATIVESPGIGNSRVPNRVPVRNSVTPEQAEQISEYVSTSARSGSLSSVPSQIISRFIKISEDNLLINGVSLSEEQAALEATRSEKKTFSPATIYETSESTKRAEAKPYSVGGIYTLREGNPAVVSSALGANYITEPQTTYSPSLKSFDPVESCRRFGGSNCEDLYNQSQERCVKGFNKSLFPEAYSEVPGVSASSIIIDRPLGTFADYVPNETLIPTTSFKNPAPFMNLLPSEAVIGEKGEPLVDLVFSEPLVYDSGGAELSEYGNTEFGIIEFVKAKLERSTEFGCAGFDSPFHYQICMNLMKCKRFSPPYNGEYSLSFCPKTLSGGRLK